MYIERSSILLILTVIAREGVSSQASSYRMTELRIAGSLCAPKGSVMET